MRGECPQIERLAAYADGALRANEQEEVEAHLVECKVCLDIVAFAMKAKSAVPRPPLPPSRTSD